jgi:glycosyltransferase involved in cell wall biosynthesis
VTEPRDGTVLGLMSTFLLPSSMRPKIVLDIRSTPVEAVGLRGYITTLCFNTSIRIAKRLFDGITIITPLMKEEICEKFHINSEFVGVWTSGVSTTLFKPEKYVQKGIELRKRIGLDGKFVIFYHGSLSFHRGLIESINSIELLKGKFQNVVLFLLGSGPALPSIKKLIQEKKLQDNVIIHAPVNHTNVPKYIALCDVGIVPLPDLPDWRHQCPLNLLEYLAMRKVVIATNIPANLEVIGKSRCGIYVSSADPVEIAKTIMYAHDNKDKLEEWGSYGRIIVKEKYSWKKVAKDFENYLLEH